VLRKLEFLPKLIVLRLGEVHPPSPWINELPVFDVMPFEPLEHLGFEEAVVLRELSRPNLPTVITTGDPHTSLSVGV
jgi:hypothetical protein